MKEKGIIKNLIKDTLVIFVVTLIAGGLLGFVNELTKEPIAIQEAKAKADACKEVFFEADANGELKEVVSLSFNEIESSLLDELNIYIKDKYSESVYLTQIYEAKTGEGELFGYVIGVTTKEGYGGEISMYTGVTMDGTLKGVSLLSIAETPGLGMNAEAVLVPQFRNVNVTSFSVVKSGSSSDSEIDAITSATITSNAVTQAVNAGLEVFRKMTEGGES